MRQFKKNIFRISDESTQTGCINYSIVPTSSGEIIINYTDCSQDIQVITFFGENLPQGIKICAVQGSVVVTGNATLNNLGGCPSGATILLRFAINELGICSVTAATFYTIGVYSALEEGMVIYEDSQLTTPYSGGLPIVATDVGPNFFMNAGGVVGTPTGTAC